MIRVCKRVSVSREPRVWSLAQNKICRRILVNKKISTIPNLIEATKFPIE